MLNGPEHASKCNIDESAWGITGQVFIIKFQFLSRILWFGHQWCYTPRPVICDCITLQTSGSWVNAPKHVAYALLILRYKGHSFSPHRMSKSLFLTRCHWEGSLSHSLSLWHFHCIAFPILPHRVQCLSSLWSGALSLSSLDGQDRTVRNNRTYHFTFFAYSGL